MRVNLQMLVQHHQLVSVLHSFNIACCSMQKRSRRGFWGGVSNFGDCVNENMTFLNRILRFRTLGFRKHKRNNPAWISMRNNCKFYNCSRFGVMFSKIKRNFYINVRKFAHGGATPTNGKRSAWFQYGLLQQARAQQERFLRWCKRFWWLC